MQKKKKIGIFYYISSFMFYHIQMLQKKSKKQILRLLINFYYH